MKYILCLIFSLCFAFSSYAKAIPVESTVNDEGDIEIINPKGLISQRIACRNHTNLNFYVEIEGFKLKADTKTRITGKTKKNLKANKWTGLSSIFDGTLDNFGKFIVSVKDGNILEYKLSTNHGDLYIDIFKVEMNDGTVSEELEENKKTVVKKSKGTKISIKDNKKETPHNNQEESVVDQLFKWKQLLDMGAITQEEYDKQKAKLLNE